MNPLIDSIPAIILLLIVLTVLISKLIKYNRNQCIKRRIKINSQLAEGKYVIFRQGEKYKNGLISSIDIHRMTIVVLVGADEIIEIKYGQVMSVSDGQIGFLTD
jgi:hypothetical protein